VHDVSIKYTVPSTDDNQYWAFSVRSSSSAMLEIW